MKSLQRIIASFALATVLPAAALGQGLSGTLKTTGGAAMPVASMHGRVVVLFFGGIVDPQSPDELPVLQKIANRYQGRGVDVYWVSVDPSSTSDADLVGYAAKYGYRGAILRDSGDVLRSAGTGRRAQLPTTVVLDKTGAIAGKPLGGFDRDADFATQLGAIVDPLLQ